MSAASIFSPLIYGTMGFENPNAQARIRVLHAAIDAGITTIDTAPLYGCGEAEKIVGRATHDRRAKVQILTKCGLRWDIDEGTEMFPVQADGRTRMLRRNCRPESIVEEVEQSLRRLKTEMIDLVQVHRWDPNVPIEETVGALVKLKQEGKINGIGLSNHPVKEMTHAHHAIPGGLVSSQNEYNLLLKKNGTEALQLCRQLDCKFIAYSSLAQGVLAGRQLEGACLPPGNRKESPYFHEANLARVERVLIDTAQPLASEYGVSLSQLSLTCLLALPGVTHVIAGGTTEEQAKQNAQVLSVSIPTSKLTQLAKAFEQCAWDPTPDATQAQRWKAKTRGALRLIKKAGLKSIGKSH